MVKITVEVIAIKLITQSTEIKEDGGVSVHSLGHLHQPLWSQDGWLVGDSGSLWKRASCKFVTETVERSEQTESRVQHRPCTKTMAQAGSFISKVKIKAIFKRDAAFLQVTMGQDWLNEGLTCKDRALVAG